MTRTMLLLGTLSFALAGVALSSVPAGQSAQKPRTDDYGDPLPERALFRIGTTRLQHAGVVRALAVSEDGKYLASFGGDKVVRVWDARDGKALWQFELPHWGPWALAFSTNSRELAAVSRSADGQTASGSWRRWDLATGGELQNTENAKAKYANFVYRMALVGRIGGDYLAAETAENDIALYAPGNEKSRKILKGHTGRVMSVCFTRDAQTLVSLSDDGTIRRWNVADGKSSAPMPVPPMKDHGLKGNLAVLAVAPDGKTLAVSLPDDTTRLLDASGRELRRLPSPQQLEALAFTPDVKTLLGGGTIIRSWNVANGEEIPMVSQARNPIQALALAPDGKLAAFADDHNRLRFIDIASGKIVMDRTLSSQAGLAFTPTGKQLAMLSGDKTITFWEVAKLLDAKSPLQPDPGSVLSCQGKVTSFAVAADGKRVVTAEDGRVARIYDTASKRVLVTLEPPARLLFGVAFSADGKVVATMGEGGFALQKQGVIFQGTSQVVRLWDSATGKEISAGGELGLSAHTVVFHPQGQSLMAMHLPDYAKKPRTGIDDPWAGLPGAEERMESLRFWEAGARRERFRLEDPVYRKMIEKSGVTIIGRSHTEPAAFSPDGRLFVGDWAGIVVFETASRQPRLRLRGHLQGVRQFAITPDGKTLVSASADSTLLIWDLTGLRTGSKLRATPDELWALLAYRDAERAGQALWTMIDSPQETMRFLPKHLKPAIVNQDRLPKLVADLDDAKFAVRDKAMRELTALGQVAEGALKKKLQAKPSLEAERRIEELLSRILSQAPTLEQLRTIRAVEVLERIGTAEAHTLLEALAAGAPGTFETEEARAALARLKR